VGDRRHDKRVQDGSPCVLKTGLAGIRALAHAALFRAHTTEVIGRAQERLPAGAYDESLPRPRKPHLNIVKFGRTTP
jgi:hypothetical protein